MKECKAKIQIDQKIPIEDTKIGKVIHKIEMFIKRIITPKTIEIRDGQIQHKDKSGFQIRKNFLCDSHPAICLVCGKIRTFLRYRRFPIKVAVQTKTGVYIWVKSKVLTYFKKGEANFKTMHNQKIISWVQQVLRHNLSCLHYEAIVFYEKPIKKEILEKLKPLLILRLPQEKSQATQD